MKLATANCDSASGSALSEQLTNKAASADFQSRKLWAIGLALLAFVVRAPGLFAGFVFDDALSFERRTRADFSRIPAFFTSDQSGLFGSNFYRPVLNVWYELFYSIFGAHPAAWHALSILVHVGCTLLVFRLALIVIEKPFAAALAAALFAVHPAHVEAISWASAIADPLWTLLMLACILAFVRWMEQGSTVWFAASLLAGASGIFVKETAVVLPAVLFVSALALRQRAKPGLPVLAATLPLFGVSILFLFVRQSVLHSFSHPLTVATNLQMVLTWPAALLFYLRHMFWPSVVVPFYPLRIVRSCQAAAFIVPVAGVTAVGSVLCYLLWRAAGWRKALLCLAWTLIPLAPALYLKALAPFELVHDRFLYAPLVGFCLAAALVLQWASERIEARTQFRVLTIASIALIPLLAIESMSLAVWWQNDRTLFTRAVEITPDNPKALVGLGTAIMADGHYQEALTLLQRALQIDPQNSGALFSLGRIAWAKGDDISAANYLTQSLSIQPRYDIWLHLASIHMHMGLLQMAEDDVSHAEAMNPSGAGVHIAKATILLTKNDPAGAIQEFQQELRNYPGSEPALAGLAQAKARESK